MHFTPTYSSWINQVERFFAYVTSDLLQRSDHRSVQALEKDIRGWVKSLEREPETVHLDQDRRPDPRITRTTSTTNNWRRTLAEEKRMPQCLYQVAYTPESLAAQTKNPQDRLEVVGKQIDDAVGAKIIAGGYADGEYDVAVIVEAPDEVSMAAVAIAIAAGGAVKAAKTTPLLSGAQWVAAMEKAPEVGARYRPAR